MLEILIYIMTDFILFIMSLNIFFFNFEGPRAYNLKILSEKKLCYCKIKSLHFYSNSKRNIFK